MVEDCPTGDRISPTSITRLNYKVIRAILTTKISKDFAAS